jgi:hypothetical protein
MSQYMFLISRKGIEQKFILLGKYIFVFVSPFSEVLEISKNIAFLNFGTIFFQ